MDVRRKQPGHDRGSCVQKQAGYLQIDPAVLWKPDRQCDGSYKEKDAAKAQAGVGEVMPQKICHKVDHIGSLRVPKQIAEAEDRIDPEKSSDESHHIVKGCLVLFLIFHLYSPAYPNF